MEVKIPRDRNGEYKPEIIAKYDRNADGMEEKILGLYACGMNQRDIAEQIKSLYDVEISPELVYPFVFMDAIHYKVKENHQYLPKAAYVVLGIRTDGRKDILGVWIEENESRPSQWPFLCGKNMRLVRAFKASQAMGRASADRRRGEIPVELYYKPSDESP